MDAIRTTNITIPMPLPLGAVIEFEKLQDQDVSTERFARTLYKVLKRMGQLKDQEFDDWCYTITGADLQQLMDEFGKYLESIGKPRPLGND